MSEEKAGGANPTGSARSSWHIVTGEFPPAVGGVGHHSLLLARGLAAEGDVAHVWCPPGADVIDYGAGVYVHREAGSFSARDLDRMGKLMDALTAPRRLVVQWVPHAFGQRSLNVGFCLWVWKRARRGDRVEILLHEPGLPFDPHSLRRSFAALIHRVMATILIWAASHVWVCAPEWAARWRPYRLGRQVPFTWLPLPTNIGVVNDPEARARIRRSIAPGGGPVIGSFGLFLKGFSERLLEWLPAVLLRDPARIALLIGRGSEDFRSLLLEIHPRLADRVHAAGSLAAEEVSHHLLACDVLLQPFPGGTNARRASVLAGLAHRRAVVTTAGPATEPFWRETGAVALAPDGDREAALALIERVLSDDAERGKLGEEGWKLYDATFDWRHTIAMLRC